MRRITGDAIDLIKRAEACMLKAYRCPAGKWTIGYGHTAGVTEGMTINQEIADMLLVSDLAEASGYVDRLVTWPILTDNQYSALVSFVFNVGPDIDADNLAEGLGDSTLLKKLNAGDIQGAADEFLKWNHAGGQILPGLTKRRRAERELFLREDA